MFKLVGKRARSLALCSALVMGLASTVLVAAPAAAQVRGLPDFTELVEQVGPAVVNIRTIERSRGGAAGSGGQDEQMLEFFRRFGIPLPPNAPRGQRPERGA